MSKQKIEAHKITKPIQLMAVWFVALLLIETAFLTAAGNIANPSWVCPILVISAICFVPLFLVGIFLMQTVFRKELQEDHYYSEWLQRREQAFSGFFPENIEDIKNIPQSKKAIQIEGNTVLSKFEANLSEELTTQNRDLESKRIEKYENNRGLFLIHSWRPSLTEGQVADVVIWLHQHGVGPFDHNSIEKVEYELGPKFFDEPVIKNNYENKFRLEVSAYGPMLCIARVYFNDSSPPVLLERYIDIEEPPNKTL